MILNLIRRLILTIKEDTSAFPIIADFFEAEKHNGRSPAFWVNNNGRYDLRKWRIERYGFDTPPFCNTGKDWVWIPDYRMVRR